METEDITAELILGLGKTFKAIRQRQGLTQKELAANIGVSLQLVKRYERGNLDEIGPNGYSVALLAKLSSFLGVQPDVIFAEVIAHSNINPVDSRANRLTSLLASVDDDDLDALLASSETGEEKNYSGNHAAWSLGMAANLTRLPDRVKARLGLQILDSLIDSGLVSRDKVGNQRRSLFELSIH